MHQKSSDPSIYVSESVELFITQSLQKDSPEIQYTLGHILDRFLVQIASQGGKWLGWEAGYVNMVCKERRAFLSSRFLKK